MFLLNSTGKFFSRFLAVSAAALVFAGLAGCVYLRLLEIKNQLKNFDENFALSGRSELVIQFKNPILSMKDVKFLIGAEPLYVTEEGEQIHHYEFDMVRAGDPEKAPLEKLTLGVGFLNNKLTRVVVPETFMLLFPRNVVIETLKGAADAEVLKLQKTARARLRLTPNTDAELPSLAKTRALLGTPLSVDEDHGIETLSFRYHILHDRRNVPISARLSFSKEGLLRRVFVTWDTSSVDIQFIRE